MAKGRKRKVIERKSKPKQWIPILAPEIFNKVEIGQVPLVSSENAVGRVVTANLMNITHDIKQQNINIRLKVKEVKDNIALTQIHSFKIMPTAVKRMTHRRIDVVEDSSVYLTKDNVPMRIKPMLFTRGNTSSAVRSALRKGMRNLILRNVRKSNSEEVFRDALSNKIQYDIEKELSKLYPLKNCVIRELIIEPPKSRKLSKTVQKEEEVTIKKGITKEEEWEAPKTKPDLPDQQVFTEEKKQKK